MNKGRVRDTASLQYKKILVARILYLKARPYDIKLAKRLLKKGSGDLKKILDGLCMGGGDHD
jgi:hypothetical protein